MCEQMKIHGRKKKNYIIEVTEFELEAIRIALGEWQMIEYETSKPETKFDKVLNRIHKQMNHFESLELHTSQIKIENKK